MTVLAGSMAALSYHQSKEAAKVLGIAFTCAPQANPASGYLNAQHKVMLSCNLDNEVVQTFKWQHIGQYTAYATGEVPSYKCDNAVCSKGHRVFVNSTIWLWDIKHGLYTKIYSDNPELFGENYIATAA